MRKGRVWMFAACTASMTAVLLLTGCGLKPGEQAAASSATPSPAALLTEGRQPVGGLQNKKELQMVLLFQGLIQMDKSPQTAFSQTQAEGLLPLVRKTVEEGRMAAEDTNLILSMLTDEQKAFYSDLTSRIGRILDSAAAMQGVKPKEMTEEERAKLAERWKNQRNADGVAAGGGAGTGPRGSGGSGGADGQLGSVGTDGQPMPATGNWAGGERNVEQQLIDLLTSRAEG